MTLFCQGASEKPWFKGLWSPLSDGRLRLKLSKIVLLVEGVMDGWMDGVSGCYFSKCGRYKTKGQAVRGVERCFSRPIPRTPRTAVRPGSWCVTSTKAAVTAASSTMWSTAS